MNVDAFIEALQLPDASRVGQRVAKKLLIEHLPPRATDKKRVSEGVEELTWIAALKPAHLGVPAYRDEEREYVEIALLSLVLRAGAKRDRIVELVHRAIPYARTKESLRRRCTVRYSETSASNATNY